MMTLIINSGFSFGQQLPRAGGRPIGASVSRIRTELIFRQCWNLITPRLSREGRPDDCFWKPPAKSNPRRRPSLCHFVTYHFEESSQLGISRKQKPFSFISAIVHLLG